MTLFDELVARADGTAPVLRSLTTTMFEPPSFIPPDEENDWIDVVAVGPIRAMAESQPTEPTVVEPITPPLAGAPTPSPTSTAAPTISTITDTDPSTLSERSVGRHRVDSDRVDAPGSLSIEAVEAAEAIAPASQPPDATLGPPDRPAGSTPTTEETTPASQPPDATLGPPDRPAGSTPTTGTLGGPPAAPVLPVAAADTGTEIHVSIGRVKVIARGPSVSTSASTPSTPPRSAPRVDLGEYLDRTTGRTRR